MSKNVRVHADNTCIKNECFWYFNAFLRKIKYVVSMEQNSAVCTPNTNPCVLKIVQFLSSIHLLFAGYCTVDC